MTERVADSLPPSLLVHHYERVTYTTSSHCVLGFCSSSRSFTPILRPSDALKPAQVSLCVCVFICLFFVIRCWRDLCAQMQPKKKNGNRTRTCSGTAFHFSIKKKKHENTSTKQQKKKEKRRKTDVHPRAIIYVVGLW